MVVEYDTRPRTQYIVSPHERPGRGDDRAARGTDARRARQNPSCGFYRNFGANARSAMPPERVVLGPSQHHAHIATDCGAKPSKTRFIDRVDRGE